MFELTNRATRSYRIWNPEPYSSEIFWATARMIIGNICARREKKKCFKFTVELKIIFSDSIKRKLFKDLKSPPIVNYDYNKSIRFYVRTLKKLVFKCNH